MLLQDALKPYYGFAKRIICRYIINIALIFAGLLLTGSIVHTISEFDTGSRGRVYAVDSSSGDDGRVQQFEAGLLGVINGVADMERYSDAARLVSVSDANEKVLAGVSGLDKRAIQKSSIGEGTKIAGSLGYYAQQAVYENQMSSDDYYTLLQIVEAEATGEDTVSKMMVANVVLNRVQDSHFPDTIYGVVWQDSQFQPTSDGRIYSCTVTESTIEAVERVLQGEDYSQGALFFCARDSADAENLIWFDESLVLMFEYGGHEYYTFKEYVDNV